MVGNEHLGAHMRAKFVTVLFSIAALSALVSSPTTGQNMSNGFQPPFAPPTRPTEIQTPAASHVERHDVDGKHMSTRVNDLVKATMAAAGQQDWTTAKAKLAEARAVSNPTAFDTFEIEMVAAFVAVNTADHVAALASYKKVIDNPFFAQTQTAAQQSSTLKNAMILANETSDYTSAIAFGAKLAAMGPVDDATEIALAFAYYGNKDYAMAKSLAQKSIDAAMAAGTKPNDVATEIVAKSSANMH